MGSGLSHAGSRKLSSIVAPYLVNRTGSSFLEVQSLLPYRLLAGRSIPLAWSCKFSHVAFCFTSICVHAACFRLQRPSIINIAPVSIEMAQSVRDALLRLHAPPAPPTQHPQAAPRRSERLRSKLLKLPSELRNEIYRLLLVKENPIVIVRCTYRRYVGGRLIYFSRFPRQPKLARTCRQIRAEA